MKQLSCILFISVLIFTGCIRHSDEGLNRRLKTRSNEKSNIKRATVNLMVNDVNKTIQFYKSIAGFDVSFTLPDTGLYDFAIISKGDVEIMLQRAGIFKEEFPGIGIDSLNSSGTFTLYIEVNDIVMVYEKAILNAEIIRELHQTMHATKEFAIKDNNGYILVFAEQLKK